MNHPAPRPRRTWPTGDVVATVTGTLAVLAMLVSLIWGYARITYAAEAIPRLDAQQQANTLDIRQLKVQQTNSDARFQEILSQLDRMNNKLDHLSERGKP